MKRGALVAIALLGCAKKDPPPQPQYGYGAGYAQPYATYAPPTPAPAPAPAAAPPAFGFPCVTDGDLQCPFAHCTGGRCGGCTSNADCKAGSQCAWSPWGMACSWPGAAPPTAGPPPTPTAFPPPTATPPSTPPSPGDPFAQARSLCLAHTNELRARVGARPLGYASNANGCSDAAAANDGRTRTAHGAFGRCSESAQNECPGWPGPAEHMTTPCLDMMFGEGPGDFSGHGHYLNMTNASYTSVACGFAVAPDGKMWMVQNFF